MYNLTIKVTKNILKKSAMCGKENYVNVPSKCAIALAVRDIFPHALVGGTVIIPFAEGYTSPKFAERNGKLTISLPMKAQIFISKFDDKTPEERINSEEFSFDIDIPDEVINQINIDEVLHLLKNHETLELKLV